MSAFSINPDRRVRISQFGTEGLPFVCIDELVLNPHGLIDLAADVMFVDASSSYPGVRAPAPNAYVTMLLEATAAPLREAFGAVMSPDLEMCAYSMVTVPPERLKRAQRFPHYDGPETDRLAFIHYLCAPEQGGTSFYRHRATRLAEITPASVDQYRYALAAELQRETPAQGYVLQDTSAFERILGVDAVFNRLVVYKGNVLHSGDIGPDTVLSEDPRRGRLTINGFGFLANDAG